MNESETRVQFSLRTLLTWTTSISVFAAPIAAEASWRSGLALLLLSFGAVVALFIGSLSSRQHCRAFCVGAMLPALLGLIVSLMCSAQGMNNLFRNPNETLCKLADARFLFAALWLVALALGCGNVFRASHTSCNDGGSDE